MTLDLPLPVEPVTNICFVSSSRLRDTGVSDSLPKWIIWPILIFPLDIFSENTFLANEALSSTIIPGTLLCGNDK